MARSVKAPGGRGPDACGPATGGAGRQRSGVALIAVVLLGTAITLLAHAGLVVGLALERAARGDARTAEVEAGVAARIDHAVAGLSTLDDPIPVGVDARRLTPELLRIRADSATRGGGRGRVSLLWSIDPQSRMNALEGGVRTGASMSLGTEDRITLAASDSCGAGLDRPTDFPPATVLPWAGESPTAIGPLDGPVWADLPAPPVGGSGAAGAFFAEGEVAMGAGSWSGLVVIDGSLDLGAGAELSGWLSVTEDVRVRQDARVEGVLRVGGAVYVDPGGSIEVAPCSAILGLTELAPFSSPYLAGPRAWPSDPTR